MAWLLVMLGGAVGSAARFGLAKVLPTLASHGFPWATLLVNALGSLLIGLAHGWLVRVAPQQEAQWRALVMVGLLGGFTTFSTLALEAQQMLAEQRVIAAIGYVAGSAVLCVAMAWLGVRLAG